MHKYEAVGADKHERLQRVHVSGAFPAYCVNCCRECQLCTPVDEDWNNDPDIHPRDVDKYSVPLDMAVIELLAKHDSAVCRLGEDAKGGEIFYLCKKCYTNKWKKHPKRGQPFNGFTQEQINNDY